MLYAVLKPWAVALMRLWFRLEARGVEHVPRTGAALVVTNHSSVLDPPIMGGVMPRQLHFMAKAELFGIPVFGRLIRALNALPVRRGRSDPAALRMALKALAAGQALLVFPEATRQAEGQLGEGRPGAGMLAVLSGAPVVPAYIAGTGRAWPRGRSFPRPAKVRVHFGRPLRFVADGRPERKAQYAAASRRMMAAIAQLREESLGAGRTKHIQEEPA
jgi:1-acyl-sn-glycerol-3-phosphate acyltransferase